MMQNKIPDFFRDFSRGIVSIFFVLAVLAVPSMSRELRGQGNEDPKSNMVLPWPVGMEEFAFPTLPAGGWNVLGTASARTTAMGETFLSEKGPAAGIVNPALLARLDRPMLSLSYRYTAHAYKTLPGFAPANILGGPEPPSSSFKRKVGYPDSLGLAFPIKRWTFSADYFLYQEYNTPSSSASFFSVPNKVKQSGETRGISLAIARSLTDSFSVGISASYLYGRISRFEVSPIYTILRDSDPKSLVEDIRRLIQGTVFSGPVSREDTDLDLGGISVSLGASYQWKDHVLLGFSLRVPFTLNLQADVTRTFPGAKRPEERISREIKLDQPFVATGSLLFFPTSSFTVAADLSYWDWKGCRSEDNFRRMYPNGFENVLKLNLGAEYAIGLPSPVIKTLALRAGYIHDPQPYRNPEGFVRDFATAGIGLKIGRFLFDAAAKIQLFDPDPGRFHANVFRVGLSYEF